MLQSDSKLLIYCHFRKIQDGCLNLNCVTRLKFKMCHQSDSKWQKYGNFNFVGRTDSFFFDKQTDIVAYKSSLPELEKSFKFLQSQVTKRSHWRKQNYCICKITVFLSFLYYHFVSSSVLDKTSHCLVVNRTKERTVGTIVLPIWQWVVIVLL